MAICGKVTISGLHGSSSKSICVPIFPQVTILFSPLTIGVFPTLFHCLLVFFICPTLLWSSTFDPIETIAFNHLIPALKMLAHPFLGISYTTASSNIAVPEVAHLFIG